MQYYAQWGGDAGLGDKLAPFIIGSANMIEQIGISHAIATTIMGVFVASFAATTLDSATRLQRYIIAELAGASERDANRILCASCGYPRLELPESSPCPECGKRGTIKPRRDFGALRSAIINRFGATTIATVTALALALSDIPIRGLANAGLGGLSLWPIFGATNQLLAALALLVLSVWLRKTRGNAWVTFIPMLFMLCITAWGIVILAKDFGAAENGLLLVISVLLLFLQLWISAEGIRLLVRKPSRSR